MILLCGFQMNQLHQFIEFLVCHEAQKLLVQCGPR